MMFDLVRQNTMGEEKEENTEGPKTAFDQALAESETRTTELGGLTGRTGAYARKPRAVVTDPNAFNEELEDFFVDMPARTERTNALVDR